MATTKFYLDTRKAVPGKPSTLKIAINHKGKTVFIVLDVHLLPNQWDKAAGKIVNHPQKQVLNNYINTRKHEVDGFIINCVGNGSINGMTATQLKKLIEGENGSKEKEDENLFAARLLKFASVKKEGTRRLYMCTYDSIQKYEGAHFKQLRFEDITKEWLTGFDTFLSRTSPSQNARNIHLRNIRAVFNEAIDDEITTFYPFRRFKIRNVATAKRSLTVEQLRQLFDYPVEPHQQQYLDMFKLIFYLVGINIVDLCRLQAIVDGRVEYHRAKTNRLYSIKVEPEAMEIIERYKGEKFLLDILDRYANHKDYAKRLNDTLQLIGEVKRVGRGGKKVVTPLFPKLTTYWARHSWATIAAELDIPKETIAAGLGHGGNTVTDIYINFDQRKVDEANRRVIDYVLYGIDYRVPQVPVPKKRGRPRKSA